MDNFWPNKKSKKFFAMLIANLRREND